MEVTAQEAKTHLSRLLRRVEAGEEIVVRRGSQRVAVLRRLPRDAGKRNIWGDLSGSMSDDFDATLEDLESYS